MTESEHAPQESDYIGNTEEAQKKGLAQRAIGFIETFTPELRSGKCWKIGTHGGLRTVEKATGQIGAPSLRVPRCPLTFVCLVRKRGAYSTMLAHRAGERLGLDALVANEIILAADNAKGHAPDVREALLSACRLRKEDA